MIYTMGMLSIMSCSEWPFCFQIHFPTPLHPLLFFWNVLKMLSGQVWPMEGTGGILEDKMPAYVHPPHFLGLVRVLSHGSCVSLQLLQDWPSIIVPANRGQSTHGTSSYCTAWLLGLNLSSLVLVPVDLEVVRDSFCC